MPGLGAAISPAKTPEERFLKLLFKYKIQPYEDRVMGFGLCGDVYKGSLIRDHCGNIYRTTEKWQPDELRAGQEVEVEVYGDKREASFLKNCKEWAPVM